GRDIGMAQHHLQAAQIGAMSQQMAGEAMTQHMRRDPPELQSRHGGETLQDLSETLPCEMARAAARGEKIGGKGTFSRQEARASFEISEDPPTRLVMQRYYPFLIALAPDREKGLIAPHRGKRQAHQFGDAQSRRVKQFD